ncbi:MAG: hypothetical protein ACHREM_20305, partial [Polyangiales bacterium]
MPNTNSLLLVAACAATLLGGCGSSSTSPTAPSACVGVSCSASDACHLAGVCDEGTGTCSDPIAPDGTQCDNGTCSSGQCVAVSLCADGAQDGSETDLDCGGPVCAPCVDGKSCTATSDCLTSACTAGKCGGAPAQIVADTGPSRAVDGGAHVVLDGSHSRSPAGVIASYSWLQTFGPTVALADATTGNPSFDAPSVDPAGALLAFTLTVADATGASATSTLSVTVNAATGSAPTTSQGLIKKAMDVGTIDRDTAAQYFAFALFGDARLPAAYLGTDPDVAGTWTARFLVDALSTLSPATQEIILPFLLPPNAPGSWSSTSEASTSAARMTPERAPAQAEWVAFPSTHAVVWYSSYVPNGLSLAISLSAEIEGTIWPKMLALWGSDHMPPTNDAAYSLFRGGTHGKLNLYLDKDMGDDGETFNYGPAPTATYIRINSLNGSRPLSSKQPVGLFQLAAHEIAHACQDSYAHSLDDAATWLAEGTATWAEDYVYPSVNSEQRSAPFLLNQMNKPLENTDDLRHAYGSYLFFEDITRGANGNPFVRRSYANLAGGGDSLKALNDAFTGGIDLSFYWGQFLTVAWNRTPGANFQIDSLMIGAMPDGGSATSVNLSAMKDNPYGIYSETGHLSAHYADFKFANASARSLFFYDGLFSNLKTVTASDGTQVIAPYGLTPDKTRGATLHVLTLKDSVWTDHAIVSPQLFPMSFCRDNPAENIDELVAVYGNWLPTTSDPNSVLKPLGLWPTLLASNIGCYSWTGTIDGMTSPKLADAPQEHTFATVTLGRSSMDAGTGTYIFQGTANVSWQISGTVGKCKYDGKDTWTSPTAGPPIPM